MNLVNDLKELSDHKATLLYRKVLYDTARKLWGDEMQIEMFYEEYGEAITELARMKRGRSNLNKLAEELADSDIMREQIINIFGIQELVAEAKERKLERLHQRITEVSK